MTAHDMRFTIRLTPSQYLWIKEHPGEIIGELIRKGFDNIIATYDEYAYEERIREKQEILSRLSRYEK